MSRTGRWLTGRMAKVTGDMKQTWNSSARCLLERDQQEGAGAMKLPDCITGGSDGGAKPTIGTFRGARCAYGVVMTTCFCLAFIPLFLL